MEAATPISTELKERVDALAARTGRLAAEVVADALEHGHSLEWQEHFIARVEAGIAAADRGDFAAPQDIERVLDKYRPR